MSISIFDIFQVELPMFLLAKISQKFASMFF